MTQTERSWWEQMRARGRGWFIFREGILRYGTRVGFWLVLLGALTFLLNGSLPSVFGLVLAWALFAAGFGLLIGFVLWNQHEKDYHKQTRVDHEV